MLCLCCIGFAASALLLLLGRCEFAAYIWLKIKARTSKKHNQIQAENEVRVGVELRVRVEVRVRV